MDAETPHRSSATIADVARIAGVSVGTVSNFLNGTATVAPATQEVVQRAMTQLDYAPNLNARSLRARSTMTLGLVVPNITNPFYTEVAATTEQVARDHGYQLMLCSSSDDEEMEARQVRMLHQRRIDGALIVATSASQLRDLDRAAPFPTVFVDRHVPGRRSITTDNRTGGRLALEHLVELGHRRIGLVIGDEKVENVQDRIAGAREILERQGIQVPDRHLVRGPQSLETGLLAARFWDEPDPPTAVFATNDIVAMGLYRVCRDRGLRLPEDVSVLGFDDVRWTEFTVPPLSTVHQDVDGMVRRALEILLEAIRVGGSHTTRAWGLGDEHEMLPPELVARGSTSRWDGGTARTMD